MGDAGQERRSHRDPRTGFFAVAPFLFGYGIVVWWALGCFMALGAEGQMLASTVFTEDEGLPSTEVHSITLGP